MTHILVPFASDWRGQPVRCRFKASATDASDKDVPLAAKNEMAPVYTLPDGVRKVRVTAKPTGTNSRYWERTVELLVTATIENADLRSGWLKLQPAGLNYTVATIRVSRFKDVTDDVVKLLKAPPTSRHFKLTPALKALLKDPAWAALFNIKGEWATSNAGFAQEEFKNYKAKWGTWPPDNWNLVSTPAQYLNVSEPKKSGVLNFAPDTTVDVGSDSVVLELAGVEAPKLFAVAWPHSAIYPSEPAVPAPFLLFIRQGNGGNKYNEQGLFVGGTLQPYPYNFDYAVSLFQCLHYARALYKPPPENAPFPWPAQKGVPNQVAKAGVNAVTVIPCNSFENEFGVLNDTEQTRIILEDLQAFMFAQAGVQDPPKRVGDTAIAAFSSGNVYLDQWLANPNNLKGEFLSNVVRAVYFLEPLFDPSRKLSDRDVNQYITSALKWAGNGDKRIRLYMRFATDAHKKLLSPGTPPSVTPYFANSSDDRFTAAVITDANWIAAVFRVTGVQVKWKWQFSHHLIAGTMLTHALALAWGDIRQPP